VRVNRNAILLTAHGYFAQTKEITHMPPLRLSDFWKVNCIEGKSEKEKAKKSRYSNLNLYMYRHSLTSPLPDSSESTSVDPGVSEDAKDAAGDELRVNLTH
jgi:hypothetical protein